MTSPSQAAGQDAEKWHREGKMSSRFTFILGLVVKAFQ